MYQNVYYSVQKDEKTKEIKELIFNTYHQSIRAIDMETFQDRYKEQIEDGKILYINTKFVKRNGKRVLVIEPHPDDGVLSAGGSLLNMAEEGYEIKSYCIFSKGGEQEETRHLENKLIWEQIFQSKAEFAQFLDAKYRNSGNDEKTFREHMKVYLKAMKAIQKEIEAYNPDIVLGPMAIGEHVDHVITNRALINLHKEDKSFQLWLYEDFPYANNERYYYIKAIVEVGKEIDISPIYQNISLMIEDKATLYMAYLSQHNKKRSEVYNTLLKYGQAIALEGTHIGHIPLEEKYYERIWQCT